MFQFRRFPSYTYLIQCRMTGYCPAGLPHSEICGSKDICSSPQLIAACHVLLRLLMPRHSPCALFSLTWRRRKVRLPPFPLSAKTLTAPLLLLFLPQTFRWLRKKYFYNCHHASLPFSLGRTSSSERMAHSIMLSSGSLVVKFCIHRPGAVRNWASLLSCTWRPTQRLNS